MKFTTKQLLEIYNNEWQGVSSFRLDDGTDVEVKVIEISDWIDQRKFSEKEVVFEYEGKFYSFYVTRWGSHFTHYEYYVSDEAVEVKPVEETITIRKWIRV